MVKEDFLVTLTRKLPTIWLYSRNLRLLTVYKICHCFNFTKIILPFIFPIITMHNCILQLYLLSFRILQLTVLYKSYYVFHLLVWRLKTQSRTWASRWSGPGTVAGSPCWASVKWNRIPRLLNPTESFFAKNGQFPFISHKMWGNIIDHTVTNQASLPMGL